MSAGTAGRADEVIRPYVVFAFRYTLGRARFRFCGARSILVISRWLIDFFGFFVYYIIADYVPKGVYI